VDKKDVQAKKEAGDKRQGVLGTGEESDAIHGPVTLRSVDAPVLGSIMVMYVLTGPGSFPNEYRAEADQAITEPSRRLAIAAGTSGTSTGASMVDMRDGIGGPHE
jgi:hypothetical protein